MEGKRKVHFTLDRILTALAIALALAGGFAIGFLSCLHLKTVASDELRHRSLLQAGDAPVSVRRDVLAVLRAFQEGYVRREPKELDSFMHRLFLENDDILVLGTNAGEWARGYRAVAEFIRADWVQWGDFRFAVDDSVVWSAGDVAWIASVGVVHGVASDRALRLSAILTRYGGGWRFRQLQFQWEDRDPRPSDLFRPRTHLQLLNLVVQHFRGRAR